MSKKTKKNPVSVSSRVLLKDLSLSPSLKFKVEEAYKSIRANITFSLMKKILQAFLIVILTSCAKDNI